MKNADIKGYYRILGLTPSATAVEIKAGYRRRANEAHPDKNPGVDTTKEFQRVAEAYTVLSDPLKRAQYDTSAQHVPKEAPAPQKAEAAPEPIRCGSCGAVTAQPRYVIFLQVMSFIFFSTRSGVQGIFCATCALKKGLRASLVTWLLGWWSLHGFFWSLEAIAKNLFGGMKPVESNARILGYQAWWFATQGQFQIARALAVEAMKLATKANDSEVMGMLGALLKQTDDGKRVARLRNRWSPFNGSFALQLSLMAAVATSIWIVVEWDRLSKVREWEQIAQTRAEQRSAPPATVLPFEANPPKSPNPFVQEPPRSTPNAYADLIPKAPELAPQPTPPTGLFDIYWSGNTLLLAPFRVVTPQGSEHFFVKLVESGSHSPAMTIFIRGGEAAEVEVPLGSYRMRYAAGRTWYGEDALFGPGTVYSEAAPTMTFRVEGNQLMGHSVELILRRDGNLKTSRIRPSDF